MIINVETACNKSEKVSLHTAIAEFPYGRVNATAVAGGLDIKNAYIADANPTIVAHAAIIKGINLYKIEYKMK